VWSEHHDYVGDQIDDKIRFFAEECDNLQGFHILSDAHSGFGGLACKINNLLNDDYRSKSVLHIPVNPPTLPEYNFTSCGSSLAGSALTIASLIEDELVTPLSLATDWFPLKGRHRTFPHMDYNPDLDYHSSAVLASVFDTLTLPYRQKDKSASLTDVVNGLSMGGRTLATVGTIFPLNISGEKSLENGMVEDLVYLAPSSSPSSGHISDYSCLVTLRGIHKSLLFKNRSERFKDNVDAENYLESCTNAQLTNCRSRAFIQNKPLLTSKPFPHIFHKSVSNDGRFLGIDRSLMEPVHMVSLVSSWSTGPSAHATIVDLARKSSKLNIRKLPRVLETGVEEDDWKNSVELLHDKADVYTK